MTLTAEQKLLPENWMNFPDDPYLLSDLAPIYHKYSLKMDVSEEDLGRAFEKLEWIIQNARIGVDIIYREKEIVFDGTIGEFEYGLAMVGFIRTALSDNMRGEQVILEKVGLIEKWAKDARQRPDARFKTLEGSEQMERLLWFARTYPDWSTR